MRLWRWPSANFLLEPDLRFEMRLARELGKTRAELRLGRPVPLSTAEFTDWLAYFALEADDIKRAKK
jgi:hypothetical protein